MAAKAIPSHLRAQAAETGSSSENPFERKHHGKSQSHMVSFFCLVWAWTNGSYIIFISYANAIAASTIEFHDSALREDWVL